MAKSVKTTKKNNISKFIKKLKNNRDTIAVLIVVMMLSYAYYGAYEIGNHMAKHKKYTIGKVVNFQSGWKTSKSAIVIYQVNDTTYKLRDKPESSDKVEIGQRFLVMYDSIDCEIGVTNFGKPLTDTTIKIPPNGWINPPF